MTTPTHEVPCSSDAGSALLTESNLGWGPSVKIQRPLADVIVRYGRDNTELPRLEFAPVLRVDGIESASGSIELTRGSASLIVEGLHTELYGRSPVRVTLADFSTIEAERVVGFSRGASVQRSGIRRATRLNLSRWRWSSNDQPVAWVGLLRGAKLHHHHCNLVLGHPEYSSLTSVRLQGNATWHLLSNNVYGKEHGVVVVDKSDDVNDRLLADDFLALEFLFGTPLRLEILIGVNSNGVPTAAQGTDLGCEFQTKDAHPPVPFSEMGDAKWPDRTERDGRDPNWMALAFPLLVKALGKGEGLTPACAAISAYVGSMVGFIDAQYLMVQVGLEALADRIKTEDDEKPVVRDFERWQQWVESIMPSLREHAIDEDSLETLCNKIRCSGQPTTTALVERILKRMGIHAPAKALQEIRRRGNVAHSLSMTRDKPYDIDIDLRRVRMIRALLAALLLRHVGYDGALQGWERNTAGWATPAEWFKASNEALVVAQRLYEASIP